MVRTFRSRKTSGSRNCCRRTSAANIETIQAKVNNYWKGLWIKHPAQCNLFGLPPALVTDIVCDMMNARHQPHDEVRNYADWLVHSYGRTFAETFPMEYGLKYHTTAAANMSTDWLGPRLYVPELREVVAGALVPTTHDVHYVNHFRYPTRGGFVAYLHPLAREASLSLGREVERGRSEHQDADVRRRIRRADTRI